MVTAAWIGHAARISQLRKSSRMTGRFVQIAIASVGRAKGHDAAKSLQTIVRGGRPHLSSGPPGPSVKGQSLSCHQLLRQSIGLPGHSQDNWFSPPTRATTDGGGYWKAQFLTDLSDDAIRTLVKSFESCPSPMGHIIVEHFHGAASRVPVERTACTLRTTGFNVLIVSQWTSADETERGIAWARDTFSALTPYLAPTRYLNYLEDDAVDPAAVAYGPNLRRLRELKTKWDPDNFFRRNVNILPRSGDAI
jgi:hypothetical protein